MENPKMSDPLSAMTGLACTAAQLMSHFNIVLSFGEMVEEIGSHGTERRGTWEVMSWDGIWRIIKAQKTLFGS